MAFEDSINEANRELIKDLESIGAKINFEIDPKADCWYVEEPSMFKIASPDDKPNPSALAHELLHIQLFMFGFRSTRYLYNHFNEHTSVFTADFISILNNNLAHFKMLDGFLKMGYKIDEFLQDTPKTYFLDGMIARTAMIVGQHELGISDKCSQTREIILLCVGAKLFEQYKLKDPNTPNGLHPSGVLDPLKEVDKELIEKLDKLFTDWNEINTINNEIFFRLLDEMLKKHGVRNAIDCK